MLFSLFSISTRHLNEWNEKWSIECIKLRGMRLSGWFVVYVAIPVLFNFIISFVRCNGSGREQLHFQVWIDQQSRKGLFRFVKCIKGIALNYSIQKGGLAHICRLKSECCILKDVETIDVLLPFDVQFFANCVLEVFSTLAIVVMSTPTFAVVVFPLALMYFFVLVSYLSLSSNLYYYVELSGNTWSVICLDSLSFIASHRTFAVHLLKSLEVVILRKNREASRKSCSHHLFGTLLVFSLFSLVIASALVWFLNARKEQLDISVRLFSYKNVGAT